MPRASLLEEDVLYQFCNIFGANKNKRLFLRGFFCALFATHRKRRESTAFFPAFEKGRSDMLRVFKQFFLA